MSPRLAPALLVACTLYACAVTKPAQPAPPPIPTAPLTAVDSLHIRVAAKALEAARAIAGVWPGAWSETQAFAFWPYREGALVVLPAPPVPAHLATLSDAGVAPLLAGAAFYHEDKTRGERPSHFDPVYAVGDRRVPAVGTLQLPADYRHGRELMQLFFLFHEAFHGHQDSAFAGRDGWGALEEPFIDPAQVSNARFRALMAVERRILAEALDTGDDDTRRELARDYLRIRAVRLAELPDRSRAEQLVERKEGSAELVGWNAALLAESADAQPLHRILRRNLLDPLLEENRNVSDRYRSQLYATGAAIGALLDHGANWRAEMERGASFPELLAGVVGMPDADPTRDAHVLARHGHARLLDHFEDYAAPDAAASFTSYDGPLVIVRGLLVTGTRYSGVRQDASPGVRIFQSGTTLEITARGARIDSRGLPAMLDRRLSRAVVTVHVDALPSVNGANPKEGSIRLERVELAVDSLTVVVDQPATVSREGQMLVVELE